MIPVPDGFKVCRQLREGGSRVPVLMFTARDDSKDRLGLSFRGRVEYWLLLLGAQAQPRAACQRPMVFFPETRTMTPGGRFRGTRNSPLRPSVGATSV
jgi:hypothetical protein